MLLNEQILSYIVEHQQEAFDLLMELARSRAQVLAIYQQYFSFI